jgi:hypothetical protein
MFMGSYQSVRGFVVEMRHMDEAFQNQGDASRVIVGTSGDRTLCAYLEHGSVRQFDAREAAAVGSTYVLGDAQDADPGRQEFLGHGVLLHIERARICIRTSLTGFPTVFLYREGERLVVASSVDRIAALGGLQMAFDPQALVELAMIGQPIMHCTLFRNLSVVPAGVGLEIDAAYGVRPMQNWQLPMEPLFEDRQAYIAAQSDALAAAVSRMDLSKSFLSLTAGLDTRTIMALLVRDGRSLPAVTMSGPVTSIDARRAAWLCRHLGMPHKIVRLNGEFVRQFSECALEASRRSGGLASFRQASEVFFYRAAGGAYAARLSGNLGNQVGRSSTEGATMRGVAPEILARDAVAAVTRMQNRHWFADIASKNGELGPLELIQHESLFASMGNVCIGGSYTTQQTPYADRTVIMQKLREPALRGNGSTAVMAIWLRDLKYRFLGDSIRTSFQRQIVANVGGIVARSPVNWGWRPSGGLSFGGVALGTLALLDMVVNTRLARGSVAARITGSIGIDGLSGFQYVDLLRERPVAEFVYDTLRSGAAQRCSVLDPLVLGRALAVGFGDPCARATLLFALDVCLAQRNFRVAT